MGIVHKMFSLIANIYRLLVIVVNLIRLTLHSFLSKENVRKGEKFATVLERLGPSFIKLGQTLSTRADLIGQENAQALSRLRDRLPPFSAAIAKAIIEKELGDKTDKLFQSFNEMPIAAASIAQVHEAVTIEGIKVAVKIKRPNIDKALKRDIELFYMLAKITVKLFPQAKRLKPIEVIDVLADTVKQELDFRFEAAAASEFKDKFAQDQTIYSPEIFWHLTSKEILTAEWIDAIPIDNISQLVDAGYDLNRIASNLAVNFFNQAYREGFFHADMHPGNLLVNAKQQIVFIDFGIMGRLDKETRIFVAEILRGFLQRDYLYVAKLHFAAGYVPSHQSLYNFAQACRSIGEPIVGLPVNQISIAKLLAQLFKITEDFAMETQPQLLLLQKTMMVVEGVGGKLNPNVNMWQLAEPWIEEWAMNNISIEAKIKDFVMQIVEKIKYPAADNGKSSNPLTVTTVIEKHTSHITTILIAVITTLITYTLIKKGF